MRCRTRIHPVRDAPNPSAPVRIPRDPETLQSLDWPGLYPGGEGAGYAGGIVSAAVDGVRIARAIVRARGA